MVRLVKEVGSSIVNRSPESLQGDVDSMEECLASTSDFTTGGFIDGNRVTHD